APRREPARWGDLLAPRQPRADPPGRARALRDPPGGRLRARAEPRTRAEPPGLGEESAQQLGVNAERLKLTIFAGAALLTASVVAFAGPIGFVGLIVPHLLRMLLGPDNRLLVPTALVGGATFLLVADTLARHVVAPAG